MHFIINKDFVNKFGTKQLFQARIAKIKFLFTFDRSLDKTSYNHQDSIVCYFYQVKYIDSPYHL